MLQINIKIRIFKYFYKQYCVVQVLMSVPADAGYCTPLTVSSPAATPMVNTGSLHRGWLVRNLGTSLWDRANNTGRN